MARAEGEQKDMTFLLEQIVKQLFKLIDVVKISELDPRRSVERELLLATRPPLAGHAPVADAAVIAPAVSAS